MTSLMLPKIKQTLGFSNSHFTFHSFRMSGASFAYNSNIPLSDIKQHGTWSSNSVWLYIYKQDPKKGNLIAHSFSKLLS